MIDVAGFRERFPKFAAVPDVRVQLALDDALPEVSATVWDSLYERGVYNLSAHLLTLSELDNSGGSTTSLLPVTSRAVGDVSVSFDSVSGLTEGAGAYNMTPQGREYFRLRKLVTCGGIAIG